MSRGWRIRRRECCEELTCQVGVIVNRETQIASGEEKGRGRGGGVREIKRTRRKGRRCEEVEG